MRLRQVLLNLVGNAIKFTPAGQVAVHVSVLSQNGSGLELEFTVADTGIGISAEKQHAVFEAFVQADGSMARKYGGTGLGLAVSSKLVQLMGGKIWVESVLGQGSSFHFTIAVEAVAGVCAPPPAIFSGVKTLLVDDNELNRRVLEEVLNRWKMETVSAADGSIALSLLASAGSTGRPFQLILLDAHMTLMDGFSVAASAGAAARVVMMLSSADLAKDMAHCRELGVQYYVVKPVAKAALQGAMQRALGGHWSPARQQTTVPAQETSVLRILLAEDNAVNERLVVRLLERRGHTIKVARDGFEAPRETAAGTVRCRPDGHPNAWHGRHSMYPDDSRQARAGPKHPHHRHDGACYAGRPGNVLRGGNGRLYLKTVGAR